MAKGKLPEDFPHLSVLNEAGIGTYAQLNKHAEDYTSIPGIGAPRAADITAAVAASDVPEDEVVADVAAQVANPVVVGQPVSAEQYQCKNPACAHLTSTIPCAYCGYVSQ